MWTRIYTLHVCVVLETCYRETFSPKPAQYMTEQISTSKREGRMECQSQWISLMALIINTANELHIYDVPWDSHACSCTYSMMSCYGNSPTRRPAAIVSPTTYKCTTTVKITEYHETKITFYKTLQFRCDLIIKYKHLNHISKVHRPHYNISLNQRCEIASECHFLRTILIGWLGGNSAMQWKWSGNW